ncbi:TGACG motif-binding factor 4 [Striga asiatica]|uniref:TGACG motif-binding factor 4 n=1 Tax=Striga asiatica TaxID=4170 RepID=A0A5A7QKE8_STRAF|nr:TGACG motif-binding factor 4 [Striga asiatica]
MLSSRSSSSGNFDRLGSSSSSGDGSSSTVSESLFFSDGSSPDISSFEIRVQRLISHLSNFTFPVDGNLKGFNAIIGNELGFFSKCSGIKTSSPSTDNLSTFFTIIQCSTNNERSIRWNNYHRPRKLNRSIGPHKTPLNSLQPDLIFRLNGQQTNPGIEHTRSGHDKTMKKPHSFLQNFKLNISPRSFVHSTMCSN